MQRANVNAMRVSVETGMRIDDVLSLKTEQLGTRERGKRVFEYVAKKTGKKAKVEISLDLWRELRAGAGEEWVFAGRNPAKHRTRQAVYKDVKKAVELLGVQGQISPHSARKTFAVELRKKSGLAEVQKALQHSNRETTNLYAFADIATRSSRDGDASIDDSGIERLANAIAEKVVEKLRLLYEKADN